MVVVPKCLIKEVWMQLNQIWPPLLYIIPNFDAWEPPPTLSNFVFRFFFAEFFFFSELFFDFFLRFFSQIWFFFSELVCFKEKICCKEHSYIYDCSLLYTNHAVSNVFQAPDFLYKLVRKQCKLDIMAFISLKFAMDKLQQ